jgi:hypothetical protein
MAKIDIVVVGLLLLCPFSSAQRKENREDSLDTVIALSENVVGAIRNNDSKFLSATADHAGIFVGVDVDRMSWARFNRELSQRRGVYCVIFDTSCLANQMKNPNVFSLLEVLLREEVKLEVAEIQGALPKKAVAVRSTTDPNNTLFTLIFRHVGKDWKLQQIEYM